MRFRTLLSAAAAVAVAAVPASAAAQPVHRDAVRIDRSAVDLEPIRLECAVRRTDAGAAVGCVWSPPTSPRAHTVRLVRFDPAVDDHRMVVFRTADLSETRYVDTEVRPGHRYAYAVVVDDEHGRVVGRSRAEWVRTPGESDEGDIERLRLDCALGSAREAIGCRWSRPTSRDAAVVNLWRSVDDGPRQLVGQFRPDAANEYRDPVPAGAAEVTYLVTASSTTDRLIARSRSETVRIPRRTDRADRRPDDAAASDRGDATPAPVAADDAPDADVPTAVGGEPRSVALDDDAAQRRRTVSDGSTATRRDSAATGEDTGGRAREQEVGAP